jgi:hypothetical protein
LYLLVRKEKNLWFMIVSSMIHMCKERRQGWGVAGSGLIREWGLELNLDQGLGLPGRRDENVSTGKK